MMPASDDNQDVDSGLTPMIDIIFLLLIFFLLTTVFVPEERVLSALLPTDIGEHRDPVVLQPPQDVMVAVFPYDPGNPTSYARGAAAGSVRAEYFADLWRQRPIVSHAALRFGNADDQLVIDGRALAEHSSRTSGQIDAVHQYVAEQLRRHEEDHPSRVDQPPVVLRCFSGLPWRYAVVVYDAVKAYEYTAARAIGADPQDLTTARRVVLAPPPVRGGHHFGSGQELAEIIH